MPSSSFFRELTEGLTRFCSIWEIVEFVSPLRRASSRWESLLRSRTSLSRVPVSIAALYIENFLAEH
ncbi:hypothetical protein D3C81_653120 [compost metagenome]